MEEKINHPKHYNSHPSGVECIDIVEHFGFNLGSAIKYIWRNGLKPSETSEEDLKKAIWFIKREIKRGGEAGSTANNVKEKPHKPKLQKCKKK